MVRFRGYFCEKHYELFQVGYSTGKTFMQSLLDLLEFKDDCLTVSVFRLLFGAFHVEENLFCNAQSTYIHSDFSFCTISWMLNLTVFADEGKILLRMLQGCVQGSYPGMSCISSPFYLLSECFIVLKIYIQPKKHYNNWQTT